MKKIIISIVSILIILTGCGKKISWEEVKDTYNAAGQEVKDIVQSIDVISQADYKSLLVELKDYINDAKYNQDQDNQDLIKRTFKVAQYIESFASLFDGNCAQELLSLSNTTKELCMSIYDGKKDDFNALKQNVLDGIDNIQNWADEQLAIVR